MNGKDIDRVRRVFSLNSDWAFHLGDVTNSVGNSHGDVYSIAKAGACPGVPQSSFSTGDWRRVNLPHDWSVELENDLGGSPSWGYKPKGKAWYRKQFMLDESLEGSNLSLEFDGVAKDCIIYFNGSILKRHYSAYAPFSVDITDRASFGRTPNVLAVYVDADSWEGWWYEGAGIYRHVRLVSKNEAAIARYGIYVPTMYEFDSWYALPEITLENTGYQRRDVRLFCEIIDKQSGKCVASDNVKTDILAGDVRTCRFSFKIDSPKLWDTENPNLYTCRAWIEIGNSVCDFDEATFGFRTIEFDAQKGFFLNGKSVKLYGTCNHQDHGGIGVAIPDSVHEYRIHRLKEMGSNAYRCAHGMPHSELLDVCDREGMLVMDVNRSFETSEQCLDELRTIVLRDRNHPSVIMWSIFNEEPLQGTPQGERMARRMRREIRALDSTRFVTGAMNGGVNQDVGAAHVLDVAGINYQLYIYDEFHNKYPSIPIVGSETTSTFSVRGCYNTDYESHMISCYDENPADWGNTVRETWSTIDNRDFASGGFMWTGFDYLGEPTPFEYPSVSSFFGMMDVCGFEKDGFWLAKSIFSDEPVCHALPHWNHSGHEGEAIRVMSHTNCEQAELYLNGVSLGKRDVDRHSQTYWEVPYEKGTLTLVGFNGGKEVARDTVETTGEAVKLRVDFANIHPLNNSGLDAAIVNFVAVDDNGREVPDFCAKMNIMIQGGELIGAANGDPNCHESFVSSERSLFNGRAQAIIRPQRGAKHLTIGAECGTLICDMLDVELEDAGGADLEVIESIEEINVNSWRVSSRLSDEYPDPLKQLANNDMNSFEPFTPIHGNGSKMAGAVGRYALYRANVTIPEKLNGRAPTIYFYQLWGKCEVWVNGRKRLDFENEWAQPAEIECSEDMIGEAQITVVAKSLNEYGGGVTSLVVIR